VCCIAVDAFENVRRQCTGIVTGRVLAEIDNNLADDCADGKSTPKWFMMGDKGGHVVDQVTVVTKLMYVSDVASAQLCTETASWKRMYRCRSIAAVGGVDCACKVCFTYKNTVCNGPSCPFYSALLACR
jgi:hypothetical protein